MDPARGRVTAGRGNRARLPRSLRRIVFPETLGWGFDPQNTRLGGGTPQAGPLLQSRGGPARGRVPAPDARGAPVTSPWSDRGIFALVGACASPDAPAYKTGPRNTGPFRINSQSTPPRV